MRMKKKGSFCTFLIVLLVLSLFSPISLRAQDLLIPKGNAGYTINFNNVSIIEYIKFVSKISGLNFLYNEEELNFNVTIVSEEETQLTNIMAALVQVLRKNGFNLVEEGNNLIVVKTGTVHQIAPVVSKESPLEEKHIPPFMTRLFTIKNGNPVTIANLIRPLISPDAILEVSADSRQMILTDITRNIEEIEKLLLSLDVPHTALEMDSYTTQHNPPTQLIAFANQILTPLSGGNPLILVPQEQTHSIFIVSTPFLIEKTLSVLEDLDSPPALTKLQGSVTGENILLYHIQHKPADLMQMGIRQVGDSLKQVGSNAQNIVEVIESMKYIRTGHALLFIGDAATLKEMRSIVETLDSAVTKEELEFSRGGFYIYKIQHATEPQLANSLEKLVENLKKTDFPDSDLISAIQSMRWVKENNSLIFTGDAQSLNKLKEILPTFDLPPHLGQTSEKLPLSSKFTTFHPKYKSGEELLSEINDLYKNLQASDLADPAFLRTLQSAKWVPSTHSLIVTGDPQSLARFQELFALLDQPIGPPEEAATVYVYKLQYVDATYIEQGLDKLAKTLPPNDPLAVTIASEKYIPESNSLVFRGPASAIAKLKEILPTLDHSELAPKTSEFFVYKPKSISAEQLIEEIKNAAEDMEKSGLQDPQLIVALKSAHLVSHDEAVMFTGTPEAIAKLKLMVENFDKHKEASKANQLYIFKPKHQSPTEIINQSNEVAKEMKAGGLADPYLIAALESGSIVSNGKAVLYTGTEDAIKRLKEIVSTFDIEKPLVPEANQFYVYKPVNMSAEQLQKHMEDAAGEMEKAGLEDPQLINALQNSRIVSDGRAVMFTGSQPTIEKIKVMVTNLDLHKERPEKATEFFVYKPQQISAEGLLQHIQTVADNMEKSGFADPYLLTALQNARIVSSGKAVLFTGTAGAIEKIKTLLPTLDVVREEEVKILGKTTFLIYKIKHVPGPTLLGHLRNMADDLERAESTEKDVVRSLRNARYVKDTNSIIFTGTAETLQRVQAIVEKFDIPALVGEAPTVVRAPPGYLIYNPKFSPGEELIQITQEFEQHLISTGVDDQDLFDVINNLKWMGPTNSIIITGRPEDTQKVYNLLERFDVPALGIPKEAPEIETVADMSFLIYKLQYHSGGEIINALKKIGTDLKLTKKPTNIELVDAISALQWIEITNSLISTGSSDTLTKLKELIKTVDVPLKQVFVEVLVIQTSLNNALNFGLRWASQGTYREKFSYATGSFPPSPAESPDPLRGFNTALSQVNATTKPSGNVIPFASGFDLGVIGDIILHKGKSYFALGSLVNALRTDQDITIVLNQKIVTQDNKNSSLFVGQNVPYTGSVVSTVGNGTGQQTASNLEYRDIGVNLSITPTVGNNDVITLDIEEDISAVVSRPSDSGSSGGTASVQGILTSKAMTKTTVSVPDKHFLVLSGQIQDNTTRTKTSIPCLGGLPLIGAAFSQNDTLTQKTNTIIFVRPHIIKSFDVYKEITTRQEDIHRSQAIAEDFDAGLELVKTPDDE